MILNNTNYENEEAFTVLIDTKEDSDYPYSFDSNTNILTYYGNNKEPNKNYQNYLVTK